MSIVYKITNTQNGKVYIGSSVNKRRFKQHIQLLKAKTHPIKEMQIDYELFGCDVFTCKLLHSFDNISDYDLRRVEEEEIKNHSELYVLYNTETTCGSHYPNIKDAKISHKAIAAAFDFDNVKSFNRTSAHKRYMAGVEKILELTRNPTREELRNTFVSCLPDMKLLDEDDLIYFADRFYAKLNGDNRKESDVNKEILELIKEKK